MHSNNTVQDEDQLELDLISALRRYYPSNDDNFDEGLNDAVDYVQDNLECCGIVNGTIDWLTYSPFTMTLMRLPSSCCGRDEPEDCPEDEAFSDVRFSTLYTIM